MFHEDAELAARVLEITLTSRGDGVPLAGVPVKAAADYLRQLVGAGHRVAICEQVEDPKLARGPGAPRGRRDRHARARMLQEGWLAGGQEQLPGRARAADERRVGLAAIDLSTGEFLLETLDAAGVAEALGRLGPAEVVVPGDCDARPVEDGVLRTIARALGVRSGSRARRAGPPVRARLARRPRRGPGRRAGGRRGRRAAPLSDRAPAGGPAPPRPAHRPPERRVPLARRDDPAQPRAGRAAPRRRPRLHPARDDRRDRDADGRPPAPAVAALAAPRPGRHRRTGSTRSRWRCATAAGAAGCARRSTACATSSGWPAAPRPGGPRRASSARCATRSSACPTWPEALSALAASTLPGGGRAAALADAVDELDLLADLAARARPRPRGPAARRARRRRRDPRGLRRASSTSCARSATAAGSTSPRSSSASASAPASRRSRSASTRCSATTSRSPTRTRPRCRADYERRQTLASAERYVTPELKEYEARVLGAEERMAAREAELFGALRAAVGQAIARVQRTARVLARLDVWTALAERRRDRPLRAARGARRLRPRAAREPPPGDRAA